MGKQRELYKNWKRAKEHLDRVFQPPEHTVVVHYSCESFYDRNNNPKSPRVTSIAVRNLDTGQTKSFSIHLIAERCRLLESIEKHYDQLEKEMLESFFDAIRERSHCKWLHWNMRDVNYGFEALENRLRALNGKSVTNVAEDKRVDLSRILVGIYGVGYIAHPRLESLMQHNSITARDFLTGKQEADAFENKQFVKLHQSTLRKVDVLANIASRAHAGDLKTLASWWEVNGRSLKSICELAKEHWLLSAVTVTVSVVMVAAKAWLWVQVFFS